MAPTTHEPNNADRQALEVPLNPVADELVAAKIDDSTNNNINSRIGDKQPEIEAVAKPATLLTMDSNDEVSVNIR